MNVLPFRLQQCNVTERTFSLEDCSISAAFIGSGLAKLVFQVQGFDIHGKMIVTKLLRLDAVLAVLERLTKP